MGDDAVVIEVDADTTAVIPSSVVGSSPTSLLYQCHQCSYRTPLRRSLRSHYTVHTTERPFACLSCPYEAKRRSDLRKHQSVRHSFLQPPPPSCTPPGEQTVKREPGDFDAPSYHELTGGATCSVDYGSAYNDDDDDDAETFSESDPTSRARMPTFYGGATMCQNEKLPQREPPRVTPPPQPADDFAGVSLTWSAAAMPKVFPPSCSFSVPHSSSDTRSTATETRVGSRCQHCDIVFYDSAIYLMHAGLHSARHPWRCNLCDAQLHDVYSFTSHFINGHKNS